MLPRSPLRIFLLALLASYAFFIEYLPPLRTVHVPYDLGGYHHPLADFAFQELRHGRFPQWDPYIYSGMSFASNVQAALFYPGTWLMFLGNLGREHLSYQSLLDLDLLHVPLGFTLCFLWLRGRRLTDLAAALGAAVFAYGGYMMVQLQHFGLIVAYAWMPLCLLGIDRSAERRSWGPLWMVAAGSALAFLGGYPPTWLVVALAVGIYALTSPGRGRVVPGTLAALIFSLLLCAAQILPTWEATHFREPELRYGVGIKDPMFFLSFVIPNYFDFGRNVPVLTNLGQECLYLGAPGLLGLILALRARLWRALLPAFAMSAVCLIVVTNPFGMVWEAIQFSPLLADVVRSAYFMAGVIPGLALAAAVGLDDFLRRSKGSQPVWMLAPLGAWALYLAARRLTAGMVAGPWSAVDAVVGLAVFTLALWVYRGDRKRWIAAALLLFAGLEYKVFGVGTRQNAEAGQGTKFSWTELGGMDKAAYAATRSDPDTRILLLEFAPMPTILRHVEWRSPMGFDPFLSTQYRELIRRDGEWIDDRTLLLDPMKLDVMERFGVRYAITSERGPRYDALRAHPRYRAVGGDGSYYKVFEYLDAKPIYRFDGDLKVEKRDPGRRILRVWSGDGGLLTFAEQAFPGWSAWIDGKRAQIEQWEIAFQAVRVPAGEHVVEFRYRERLLNAGLGVSAAALLGLIVFLKKTG